MDDYFKKFWEMSDEQVAERRGVAGQDSPQFMAADAVLQARLLLAQKRTAELTKWMTIATFAAAVAAVIAAIVGAA